MSLTFSAWHLLEREGKQFLGLVGGRVKGATQALPSVGLLELSCYAEVVSFGRQGWPARSFGSHYLA